MREVDSRAGTQPSLLYAVKQVELAVRAHLDDILKESGVTAVQFTALTVLRRRDGLTSAQLARNSFVKTQSMADIVTALENGGLISRRRDPSDNRRILISLTEKGRLLLRRYDQPVRELEDRMVADLTAKQVRDLRDALNHCRAALADHPPH
ncbi:DNA-binding MarR family transcriptional regulator [Kribbella sp. VKM Ac-2527]|uniref:DNA-binding MarR family transcriptional regulator n=1 Tax=Kribbella caucasensis TaxID=2512215 RepID=A0A4R6KG68_9ACTN|nr:MarR family transcriptional regulator [Kribbella sp. VKM Ac-2527]TDO48439.1 DNA-binding MarR family transcriptional regulator [Kribbella sp. VKM Ac-2527]